ncbi:HPP family protein [Halorarum salinum]|uniref:HPP family protein n=1 Tax=Halorarum salinum TaxID=2743089 RepID=A0A7D5QDX6_9EURY|nr:HPP family protein [Halobaculum salinum]QLG63620.1 HPP family protein [Halobaculum salinum]
MQRTVTEATYAGALLAVAGTLAWITGRPLVFPSLGPSAYLLAADPGSTTDRELLGGHAVGVLAGLASYHSLAAGSGIFGGFAAGGTVAAHLIASAVASVVLTTAGMALTDTRHAPACATTLIVSLGLLPTLADALVIAVGVSGLYAASVVADRFGLSPSER